MTVSRAVDSMTNTTTRPFVDFYSTEPVLLKPELIDRYPLLKVDFRAIFV